MKRIEIVDIYEVGLRCIDFLAYNEVGSKSPLLVGLRPSKVSINGLTPHTVGSGKALLDYVLGYAYNTNPLLLRNAEKYNPSNYYIFRIRPSRVDTELFDLSGRPTSIHYDRFLVTKR